MNRLLPVLTILLLSVNTLSVPNRAFASTYSHNQLIKLKQRAIGAFLSHRYHESQNLFGKYCRNYDSDAGHLEADMNKVMADLKQNSKTDRQQFEDLKAFIDERLGFASYKDFRNQQLRAQRPTKKAEADLSPRKTCCARSSSLEYFSTALLPASLSRITRNYITPCKFNLAWIST
jgi:hypothetical protein